MQHFQTGSASLVRWLHALKIWAGNFRAVLPSCVTLGRKHHCCPVDGTWATLWGLWAGLVGLELAQHTGLCCGDGLSRAGVEF